MLILRNQDRKKKRKNENINSLVHGKLPNYIAGECCGSNKRRIKHMCSKELRSWRELLEKRLKFILMSHNGLCHAHWKHCYHELRWIKHAWCLQTNLTSWDRFIQFMREGIISDHTCFIRCDCLIYFILIGVIRLILSFQRVKYICPLNFSILNQLIFFISLLYSRMRYFA